MNPWYELPTDVSDLDADLSSASDRRLQITAACRIELEDRDLILFFQHDEIMFVFTDDASRSRNLVNPIRYFLTYKTFINYNLIGQSSNPFDTSAFEKVHYIRFKVERMIQRATEIKAQGRVIKGFYHEGEDQWLEIAAGSIVQYLFVLNPTLYYSLAHYLIGCENPRYFLIEFYKAVEVIRLWFGNEKEFLDSLRPYGVEKSKFKAFTKLCNPRQSVHLDIARHAPARDVPLYSVDLRNLLNEPHSREVFESSTVFCRQVIDAYMAFLIQQAA